MIIFKKAFILIIIFFSLISFCYSKIQLKIIMKIDNEIITSHDIEQEINYLKALNPGLNQISKEEILTLAKKSIIKEFIKRKEIEKYKKLNLENPQINNVLSNLIQNLNLQNENELEIYLNNFNFSVVELKRKIEIENEWKNLIYSKYKKTVKIDKKELIDKIEKSSNEKFLLEYNLSEIVFTNTTNISLDQLFENLKESLKKNGFENTANLYSISESSKVGGKIGWVKKNSLSDIIIETQKLNINVTDIEILRLHYAHTLSHWYKNIQKHKDEIVQMFDKRFYRMWEFYLLASKYSFVNMGNIVLQIQIAKNINNLPLTRNYMYN